MTRALAGLVVLLSALAMTGTSTSAQRPVHRVLFIGNSLTVANDMPRMVANISQLRGTTTLLPEVIAFPDHSLEDHWNRPDARAAIARGGWQTVVLQQGPSALPESQVLLREYTRRFDTEIRKSGARTALYMVWPSKARAGDFDGVATSYRAAAKDVGAVLLPAGDAWRAAWRLDSSLALYDADGFHPSQLGSLLAALVIGEELLPAPLASYSSLTLSGDARSPFGRIGRPTLELLLRASTEAVAAARR